MDKESLTQWMPRNAALDGVGKVPARKGRPEEEGSRPSETVEDEKRCVGTVPVYKSAPRQEKALRTATGMPPWVAELTRERPLWRQRCSTKIVSPSAPSGLSERT